MSSPANEKRLIASQIIVDLYEAKELTQLQLLKIAVDRSIEELTKKAAK